VNLCRDLDRDAKRTVACNVPLDKLDHDVVLLKP